MNNKFGVDSFIWAESFSEKIYGSSQKQKN